MKNRLLIVLIFFAVSVFAQDNLNNKFRLAQNYARAGEIEKAKNIYIELLEKQPWNIQFLQELNNTYLQLKEYNSSVALLENRIQMNPQDINFYGMLGSTYYTMGNSNKAFEIWERALTVNAGNAAFYRVMANYAIENRAFDKAIEFLEMGKEATNNKQIFSFELANLYSITMKYSSAAEEYLEILKEQPEQLASIKNRISAFINNHGAFEEAVSVIESEKDKTIPVLDLLSFIYMQNDEYDKAFEIIKIIDDKSAGGGGSLYNFAQGAYREKKYDTCSEAYELFFERYPNSPLLPSAKLNYVQALDEKTEKESSSEENSWMPLTNLDTINAYRFEPVLSAYRDLIEYYPNAEVISAAYYGKAEILYKKFNRIAEAEDLLKKSIQQFPISNGAVRARILMGELMVRENKVDDALGYFNEVIRGRADGFQKNYSRFMIAKVYFWQNKYDPALKELDLITNDLSDDNANDALELISIINLFRNDSLNLSKFSAADLLIFQKKFDKAEEILAPLSNDENIFLLNDLALYNLAIIKIARKEYLPAVELLEKFNEKELITAYSDKALFLLGNTYQFGMREITKAEESYKKLLEKFPNSLYFDRTRQFLNDIRNKENSI